MQDVRILVLGILPQSLSLLLSDWNFFMYTLKIVLQSGTNCAQTTNPNPVNNIIFSQCFLGLRWPFGHIFSIGYGRCWNPCNRNTASNSAISLVRLKFFHGYIEDWIEIWYILRNWPLTLIWSNESSVFLSSVGIRALLTFSALDMLDIGILVLGILFHMRLEFFHEYLEDCIYHVHWWLYWNLIPTLHWPLTLNWSRALCLFLAQWALGLFWPFGTYSALDMQDGGNPGTRNTVAMCATSSCLCHEGWPIQILFALHFLI